MAKRRKVEAPSAGELDKLEAEFARVRPSAGDRAGAMAPIAQVARAAADATEPLPAKLREAQARDAADAQELRDAQVAGRMIVDMPLDWIDDNVMIRDRAILDADELKELEQSIDLHGVRLPIEVYDQRPDDPVGTDEEQRGRYALISGYRRFKASQSLSRYANHDAKIRTLIRKQEDLGGAIIAMVTENEVRAQLTQYERGRIAVVAAQQGTFVSTDEAVAMLFGQASKAKRSKIRSFATIFEDLGDLLEFPTDLKEKDGLRIANALRNGGRDALRDALSSAEPVDADDELRLMQPIISKIESSLQPEKGRGGRPRSTATRTGWISDDAMSLSNGIIIEYGQLNGDHTIRLRGERLDRDLVDSLLTQIARLLEAPR